MARHAQKLVRNETKFAHDKPDCRDTGCSQHFTRKGTFWRKWIELDTSLRFSKACVGTKTKIERVLVGAVTVEFPRIAIITMVPKVVPIPVKYIQFSSTTNV